MPMQSWASARRLPDSTFLTCSYDSFSNLPTLKNPNFDKPFTSRTEMANSGPTSRPSGGPDGIRSYKSCLPPISNMMSPNFNHSYDSMSASPNLPFPGYPDLNLANGSNPETPNMSDPNLSDTHLSSAGLRAQKRVYRERRKDPSCDACRERKVKCDATDTTSCFECSSRQVKCQFTKETNRRMSSINTLRHIQDLERQLVLAREHIKNLKSASTDRGQQQSQPQEQQQQQQHHQHQQGQFESKGNFYNTLTIRRTKPTVLHDFSKARTNIRKYGHGIFKPPQQSQQTFMEPSKKAFPMPDLPARHVGDELLRHYHTSIQVTFPILHWPSFTQTYEEVYREGSLQNVPQIWAAILFAVFAFGALHHSIHDGYGYLETSKTLIDLWSLEYDIDYIRCALLSSIFLVEMNIKSAGWAWLGFAVRISQDIGLHSDIGTWSASELEMRRRVWWSVYAYDRLLSLELGRPAAINDEDCNVELPAATDEKPAQPEFDRLWTSPSSAQPSSPFLSALSVVREISSMLIVLKSPSLSPTTLKACDAQFAHCLEAFPSHHRTRTGYLDPCSILPVVYLQNSRFILHRHNLTVFSAPEVRAAALDHCNLIARDTTQLLSRCMTNPPTSLHLHSPPRHPWASWKARLVSAASAFLCTHIWRCTLLLCLRGDFKSALICAEVSSTFGDARPVNVSCGKYLAFFLDRLLQKAQLGLRADLENDEEMIAYVSGDLQGNIEQSWVWHGKESTWNQPLQSPNGTDTKSSEESLTSELNGDSKFGQAGWNHILEVLKIFDREQSLDRLRHDQGFSPSVPGQSRNSASSNTGNNPAIPIGSNRISIANII